MTNKLYCPFRRTWVASTPEEGVRQAFLRAMVEQLGYPQSLIAVEVPIEVGAGVTKRCDAVVYASSLLPLMLLEFKAPEVEISPPSPAPVERIKGKYRFMALARGKNPSHFRSVLRAAVMDWRKTNRTVDFQADVDALNLL